LPHGERKSQPLAPFSKEGSGQPIEGGHLVTSTATVWHEDDDFWVTMRPYLFDQARLAKTPTEIDQLIQLAGLSPGMSILDLGCGPGRHALELARRGFRVTGVDRTGGYVSRARELADTEGLDVEFVQADMRQFLRPGGFEVGLSLFTSFGYFEDPAENRQVLVNAYRSLRDGGKLVMELMGKEVLARIFQERGWREQDDVLLLEERKVKDGWRRIESRWILVGEEERREFLISHWLYSAAELSALLAGSGFRSVDAYGGLDGGPYDHTAKRLVMVAQR
jgi:SAM-dependent methyltransferase